MTFRECYNHVTSQTSVMDSHEVGDHLRADRPSDFSRIVRTQREALKITQGELASRAGVTRQLVARIENGTGDPALSNVLRVLAALELRLSADSLVTRGKDEASTAAPRIELPRSVYDAVVLPKIDFRQYLSANTQAAIQRITDTANSAALKPIQERPQAVPRGSDAGENGPAHD